MKKKFLVLLQYVFFAALAAFFVWLGVKNMTRQDWVKLEDSLHRANYWLLVPVLGLLLASHSLRALRWRQLIVSMGYKTSFLNCFLAVLIGYFANIGPRLGEVLKCTIIARYDKVPADKLVGTIVAERAFDLICLMTVFVLALIFQYDVIHALTADKIEALFHNAQGQISWLKIALLLIAVAIIFFVCRWVLKSFGHITIVQKVKNIFVNIWHGLTSVRGVKNKPLFFVYTVGIWCLYLLSTWFGFFAISATSHLTIVDALSVLAMGSVGMIISPGGIGAYSLLVAQTVAFYGIPAIPDGQALGWLLWFGQFLSFILFGTVSFILLPRINKNRLVIEPTQKIQYENTTDRSAKNI